MTKFVFHFLQLCYLLAHLCSFIFILINYFDYFFRIWIFLGPFLFVAGIIVILVLYLLHNYINTPDLDSLDYLTGEDLSLHLPAYFPQCLVSLDAFPLVMKCEIVQCQQIIQF